MSEDGAEDSGVSSDAPCLVKSLNLRPEDRDSPYTIEEMKTYITVVEQERTLWLVPNPTRDQPLPADTTCKWCRRSRRSPNPIPAHTYEKVLWLPFRSPTSHECVPAA